MADQIGSVLVPGLPVLQSPESFVARDKSVFDNLPEGGQVTGDEPPQGIQHASQDRSFFGHPRGLSTLFFCLR